jgi:hypothetical protein
MDTLLQRIESSSVALPNGCIISKRSKTPGGYARINVGKRPMYVHRVAYELAKGPIPNGYEIDHLCRNPACCNPDHLEVVTRAENNRRSNSVSAVCSRMTHCAEGHALSGANLIIRKNGQRRCRECNNRWHREYKKRRLAVAT